MALRRNEIEQILVVARQLGLPDGVRRCGAAERAVEAGEVADLRRCQVEEHARHAALRYVPEARADTGTVRRQRRAHGTRRNGTGIGEGRK